MLTDKELDKYNRQGAGQLAKRCHAAELRVAELEEQLAGMERLGWLNLYRSRSTGLLRVTGVPKMTSRDSEECRSSSPVDKYIGATEIYVTKPRRRVYP